MTPVFWFCEFPLTTSSCSTRALSPQTALLRVEGPGGAYLTVEKKEEEVMVRVKINGRQFNLSWDEFMKALDRVPSSAVEFMGEVPAV